MIRIRPINIDEGGAAKCIKAGYYKYGWTNFTRSLLGIKDGFSATAIIEIHDNTRPNNTESEEELR